MAIPHWDDPPPSHPVGGTEGMRRLPRPWEPGSGEICAQPGGKMNGWVPCPKMEVWFRSFFLAKMGDL